jgi:hypothetical protein
MLSSFPNMPCNVLWADKNGIKCLHRSRTIIFKILWQTKCST